MANIKITDLTAYGDPTSTDVLPIVDVGEDVTKQVSIADLLKNAGSGTYDAPGIAFDGDPDTGIYRPDADQLAISTYGVERLRITSDGNVGLGTSDPGALFHSVNTSAGAAAVAAAIQNSSSTVNTEVRLAFVPNSTLITDNRYAYVGSINEIGSTPGALTFGTGAGQAPTERLRITSAGVLQIADAGDIAVGTTTGTKIGTATSQKIGFYNAAPVVQPTAVADITTTATSGSLPTPDGSVTIADAATPTVTELLEYCVELEAKLEAALGHLRTLGLIAT